MPRIDGIVLTSYLAEGLRGSLYAGTDGRGRVAVKVLRRGASLDTGILERFLRHPPGEGGADAPPRAPAIRHPNLLPVERIGATEEGTIFYSMPLLRGDSLDRLIADLKRGSSDRPSLTPFSVGPGGETHPQITHRAAEALAEAAEALGASHRAGIVHRRVSPRNMICTPASRLVITDFGGAPSTGSTEGLAYVAPEEIVPSPQPPGPAADVYSFGVILYEVFARRLPYAADTPQEMKKAIARSRFPVPRSIRSDVPAALEAVILKAMARTPAERYPDAGELAEDLRRFLRHETPRALREARAGTGKAAEPAPFRAEGSAGRPLARAAAWLAAQGPSRRRVALAAALTFCAILAWWWAGRRILGPADVAAGLPATAPAASRGDRGALVALDPGRARAADRPPRAPGSLIPEARLFDAGRPDGTAARAPGPSPSVLAAGARSLESAPGAGNALAHSLGIGVGRPEVPLAGHEFLALHDALLQDLDGEARRLLCGWDLETLKAIDMAPRPASLAVPPNIRLELGSEAPGSFTCRSIRAAAALDPGALLDGRVRAALLADGAGRAPGDENQDAAGALARREEVVRELIRAQASLAEPGVEESIASIGREHWMTNGLDALRALADSGAHGALMDLARSRLPLELREAALLLLGMDAILHRDELRDLAARSPDPPLRRAAFRLLAQALDEDMLPEIAGAIDDPSLREEALAALGNFPSGASGATRLAVDLLGHRAPGVRERAVAVLAREGGLPDAAAIAPVLLSPRRAEREAAFEVVRARGLPGDVALALDAFLVRSVPAPREVLQSP